MKISYLGFTIVLIGMMFLLLLGGVFEYTSLYRNMRFELRNALMESSKLAIIPRIECEDIKFSEEQCLASGICDEQGYVEACYEAYMEEDEFVFILNEKLENYRKDNVGRELNLFYFQNNPLLVRASINAKLKTNFIDLGICVDEAILEN